MDQTDTKILSTLQTDAHISMARLSEKVGLSLSACHRRVKMLESNGVIAHYAARLDRRRLGLFLLVQALNIGCASWVLAVGMPGFEGQLAVVNWVVGLLFIIRAVQNNSRWSKARRESKHADPMEDRKAQIRAALERGESEE